MLQRTLPLWVSVAVALGVLVSFASPASAAGGNVYRMVLRYYDPIQITYNISYPANDDRGEWTGPEDVPIGGVGTPNASNEFAIDSYIASQIYCVDPFMAFHSLVPGLGGNFQWNGGAMADTVSGYVEAAPWVQSGAMQAYGSAVAWLATNGYRGVFNYGGTDDAESQASLARLNAMFPDLAPISKTVAVMATKVAIWKVVAGDSVGIQSTTLDGTPDRAKFDTLVTDLVTASESASTGTPIPGQLATTSLGLAIDDSTATYDTTTDPTMDYYGPLTATATLTNPASGASLADMTQVFLTANGVNSTGVQFVSQKSSSASLPSGTLPGTAESVQYVAGSGAGDTWTSDQFYLAIPSGRTPARGDQLVVNAMAQAPGIAVQDGTPVVFAFQQDGGVQDWNAIQAFIGGLSQGQVTDLYGETTWSTGDTSLGNLYVSKQVVNASPNDQSEPFTFAVYSSTDPTDTNPARVNLTDYPVRGASSVNTTDNTFTLLNGSLGILAGLPMTVNSADVDNPDYYYWVEEVGLPTTGYESPSLTITSGTPYDSGPASVTGSKIGPFQLSTDRDIGLALVSVTNTRLLGEMTVQKKLSGSPGGWDVDANTSFSIRVKDVTWNNYLKFGPAAADGSYPCIGNSGSSDPTTGDTLPITANQPVTITNLWSNASYEVQEVDSAGYLTTTYTGNPAAVVGGQTSDVTITNAYENGVGSLTIDKKLAGDSTGWGVSSSTVFQAKVQDTATGQYLNVTGTGPEYTYNSTSAAGSTVSFTAGQPAVIVGIPAGTPCKVVEVGDSSYTASYTGNGVTIANNTDDTVTVTNTYANAVGKLTIDKALAGDSIGWGVDNATVFQAKVQDTATGQYLTVSGTAPAYTYTGTSAAGSTVSFTVAQSAVISGIPAGTPCTVVEVIEAGGPSYTASYTGNGVAITNGTDEAVTVTNTYASGVGSLTIDKKLAGDYAGAGVTSSTVFQAKVQDTATGQYLTVSGTAPDYTYTGLNAAGSTVSFTAGQPAVIGGIPAGTPCTVEEVAGNYQATYTNNGVVVQNGQNGVVTLLNTYVSVNTGGSVVTAGNGGPGSWAAAAGACAILLGLGLAALLRRRGDQSRKAG